MSIDYARLERYLSRCAEVASEPGMNAIVVAIYNEALKGPATVYLMAATKYTTATIAFEKENKEAFQALSALDAPYRVARAAVATVHPETVTSLPDTLKSLSADTDMLNAIKKLLGIIDGYATEAWTGAVLNGEFGTKAAAAIKEIGEAISANTGLSDAITERAAAYGPAYEKYMSFKQVVRNALGPASKHYRRIHMRASPKGAVDVDEDEDEGKAPTEAKPVEGSPKDAKPVEGTPEAAKPVEGAPEASKPDEGAPKEPK